MISYYLSLLSDPEDAPLMVEMYELYHKNLYKYAFALLHNQDDAEDAVQAAWERVARNFTTSKKYFMESHKSFFSYTITIVKNLSIDEMERRKKTTEMPGDWDVVSLDDTEIQGEYGMMVALLKAMPNGMRIVLEMQLAGYSFKEIGKKLVCSEDAAQKRYSRALMALKERMGAVG